MAKVDGPLFSLEARGKIADAVVFFPWKGRHIVRQWLKPTNKQSTTQGYLRSMLKAISKFVGKVAYAPSGTLGPAAGYELLTASVPAGLNWNAWVVQGLLDQIQDGGVLDTDLVAGLVSDFSSNVTAAARTAFSTQASAYGLENFTFGYGYTDEITAGLILYLGAVAIYNLGLGETSLLDTNPVSWVATDVNEFATMFFENA